MAFYFETDERQLIAKAAKEFAEKECAPFVERAEQTDEFPLELFRRAGELGFLGITVPEEFGGTGSDLTTLSMVCEEISKVFPTLGQIIMAHTGLSLQTLQLFQDKEEMENWLPKAAAGELVGCTCLTEPCGNSDMGGWTTTCTKDGDDWIINGQKIFCTNVGAADFYIVAGVSQDKLDMSRAYGATGFLVPKGTPGVHVDKVEDKIGWRGSSTGTIHFDDVRVPDKYRLGNVDTFMIDNSCPYEVIAEGACALGIAEAAYEKTLAFAKQRVMPDGTPYYYRHETMRTRITEMRMKIEAMRGLVYMYCDLCERGENVYPNCQLIKPFTASCAQDICSTAIDLFGGLGVCRDTGIERYWREAKICMIGGGQYDMFIDTVGLMS